MTSDVSYYSDYLSFDTRREAARLDKLNECIPYLGDEVVVIDGQRSVVVQDEGAAVRRDVLHPLHLVAEPQPAL